MSYLFLFSIIHFLSKKKDGIENILNFYFFIFYLSIHKNMVSVTQFLAEIVGTFIFMLVILNLLFSNGTNNPVLNPSGSVGIGALIIGLGLAVSIYITAGLGGFGHLNPVATGVAALNGSVTAPDALLLILSQIIGGGLAFLVFWGMGNKKSL